MKKVQFLVLLLIGALTMTSCHVTKTSVNGYNQTKGVSYQYGKAKQCYLFWGLLPVGRTTVATPTNEPCLVKTKFKFVDLLVSGLTGGIFGMQTVEVRAKRVDSANGKIFDIGEVVTYKKGGKYLKVTIDSYLDEDAYTVKMEDGSIKKAKAKDLSK